LLLVALGFAFSPTLASFGGGAPVGDVRDLLNRFFGGVKDRVIQGADRADQYRRAAEEAAKKTARDFASCPSPAAQQIYNELKANRDRLQVIKTASEQADADARASRDRCRVAMPPSLDPECDAAYATLLFRRQAEAAGAAITAIDKALNVLKDLKCIAGCDRAAVLLYPTPENMTVAQARNPRAELSLPGATVSTANGSIEITACTAWDAGSVSASLDAGNGELDASVRARLPHCTRTETFVLCTQWELSILLPKLQQINVIPPTVKLPEVSISIPNKEVRVVTGVTTTACLTPVTICKRAQGTISFDTGDPLSMLTGNVQGCVERVQIGCANPAFGLTPTYTTVQVPDLAQARVTWKGTASIKGGSITVDLTKPEFRLACKSTSAPQVPGPPRPGFGTGRIDLPFLCRQPRWVNVVANP
jgi:hypothetical protein